MIEFVCLFFMTLGPQIRVRCTVDDGLIIHDYTDKNIETSPWVLPEHEKEKKKTLLT